MRVPDWALGYAVLLLGIGGVLLILLGLFGLIWTGFRDRVVAPSLLVLGTVTLLGARALERGANTQRAGRAAPAPPSRPAV